MLKRIKEEIEQLITEQFIPKLQKVEGLEYQPYDDYYGNYGIAISGEASDKITFRTSSCKLGSKEYKTLEEIDLEKWLKQKKASAKSQAFKITQEYWDKQKKAYGEIQKFLAEAADEIDDSSYGPKVYQIRNTDIKIYLYEFPVDAIGLGVNGRSPMKCVSISLRWNDKIIPTSFKKQLKKILILKETKANGNL